MKKIILFSLLILSSILLKAQTALFIPDTLTGSNINLNIADSSNQFFPGFNTATIGYNGRYLGPTIILDKGQTVTMNVTNQLIYRSIGISIRTTRNGTGNRR